MKSEPSPFNPNQKRYSRAVFPPYRFIQGITPHPHLDPYEIKVPENERYLYAIDLYNFNYWWEAHEGWEALWKTTARTDETGQFLQGLIQVSAAMIKWWIGNEEGMKRLLQEGTRRLKSVGEKVFMELDLPAHLAKIERFRADPTKEDYPFIVLLY